MAIGHKLRTKIRRLMLGDAEDLTDAVHRGVRRGFMMAAEREARKAVKPPPK